jgi:hypothetical protein
MNLSAPTYPVFLIAIVLAIIAAFARYGHVDLGLEPFHWALLAFVILAAGNLMRRL